MPRRRRIRRHPVRQQHPDPKVVARGLRIRHCVKQRFGVVIQFGDPVEPWVERLTPRQRRRVAKKARSHFVRYGSR